MLMNKVTFRIAGFLACALTCAALNADPATGSQTKRNPGQAIARYNMKHFGGRIRKPNSEKGRIVFVNQQRTVAREVLEQFVAEWSKRYRYTMEISNVDVQSGKGCIVIRLEDLERAERLILAPENFWVSVNAKGLSKDNPPTAILNSRFTKELKRAFAFVCCGTCSDDAGGLCGVVTELADLDSIAAKLYSPDVDLRIANSMPSANVEPYRICRYSDAVTEGWAPAPTNEYQKAIWDKVHSVPEKPLKIEFDPATQKGKVTK